MSQSPANDKLNAFVTLITSDSYLPGAVNLAHSLLDVHGYSASTAAEEDEVEPNERNFMTICMVTPVTVSYETVLTLRNVFDLVVGVEEIQGDIDDLAILGRPDLRSVLTKLHVFRLEQFRRIIFLDADTLVLRPILHLFGFPSEALHAAPDAGWPDCFNSGVMVLTPRISTFDQIVEMVQENGSFDGGDQGILNDFFPDWQRLSFSYNATPTPAYSYAPAYRRHGASIHIVHFIGASKPWLSAPPRDLPTSSTNDNSYESLVRKWYESYYRHYPDQIEHINKGGFKIPLLPPAWSSGSDQSHRGGMNLDDLKKIFIRGARRNYSQGGTWSSITGANFVMLPGRPMLLLKAPPFLQEDSTVPRSDNSETKTEVVREESQPSVDPSVHFQMREPFNTRAQNAWDHLNNSNQKLFCPPGQYPPVPEQLVHEGSYDSVMKRSASTSQFPWERPAQRTATRVFPGDPPRQRKPSSNSASVSGTSSANSERNVSTQFQNSSAHVKGSNGGFQNAWDSNSLKGSHLKEPQLAKSNFLGLKTQKHERFDFHRAVEAQDQDDDGDDESEDRQMSRTHSKVGTAEKPHVHYGNVVRRVDTDSGSPVVDTTATISNVPLHSPTHESHLQHYDFEPHSTSNSLAPPRSRKVELASSSSVSVTPARVFSPTTDTESLRTDTQETLLRFISEASGSTQRG